MNQDSYQYYFESMPENSIFMEYIIFPLIIFLIVLLIYQFIKKRIMKDDKNELESLKLLQELLEKGTINDDEFKKKRRTKLFQNGKCILKFDIKIKGKIIK